MQKIYITRYVKNIRKTALSIMELILVYVETSLDIFL